jgi:glutamyl-tRNA synthetase
MLWPIRTALSGKPSSPCGATELCELLGKDETMKRLTAGIKLLENL